MSKEQLKWEKEHLNKLSNLLDWCGDDPLKEDIQRSIDHTNYQIDYYEGLVKNQQQGEENNG